MSIYTNDHTELLSLKLEWKVLDPYSFATFIPTLIPGRWPQSTGWKPLVQNVILEVSWPEFEFWLFSYRFVNLAVLGNFWEFNVLVHNIYQWSQKAVRAGLVFLFLRWGTASWQGYMPARQLLCQGRPDPDQTHSFLTAILLYCSTISPSNWKFSSQTTF